MWWGRTSRGRVVTSLPHADGPPRWRSPHSGTVILHSKTICVLENIGPRIWVSLSEAPRTSSHQEAPHEIHLGEWQDTPHAIVLCAVRRANRGELPTRYRSAAPLLQLQMLRRSLQSLRPCKPISCDGIAYWTVERYWFGCWATAAGRADASVGTPSTNQRTDTVADPQIASP